MALILDKKIWTQRNALSKDMVNPVKAKGESGADVGSDLIFF